MVLYLRSCLILSVLGRDIVFNYICNFVFSELKLGYKFESKFEASALCRTPHLSEFSVILLKISKYSLQYG